MGRSLESFRGAHEGGAIVVCGCGVSLGELVHPERFVTIGVNDVGRLFDPTYLVVVNNRTQFTGDRFRYVERSRARYLFTQLDLAVTHPDVVRFRLGRYGGTTFDDPNVLHHTRNSPYVALCLAVHMGARLVGVIGVDFADHHFFGRTGAHALATRLPQIDAEYRRLGEELAARGIRVVNLSSQSRLTAWPAMSLEEFASHALGTASAASSESSHDGETPLTIVSYSTTPVAGVPAVLARCIAARTPHRARCVWAERGYGNGVTFEGDIEWKRSPAAAEAALAEADVVIVHNGRVDARHRSVLAGKPTVTMAHNYMWNVDGALVAMGFPGVVVGQYQATLPEFAGWPVVPNPVPFWEPSYQPGPKDPDPTICYTPSGKHERYPAGHRLYWHAKGYDTTMRVLDRLAARGAVRCEVVRGRQVAHADALAMKRRSHIVIDECVTGSYHRNSLEGLSAGCVVVNGVGILPGVADAARRCAPEADRLPFTFSRLDDLETTLTEALAAGVGRLDEQGRANREWLERHWEFGSQWDRFWSPVVARALERGRARDRAGRPHRKRRPAQASDAPTGASAAPPAVTNARAGAIRPDTRAVRHEPSVSVVVCHGGQERLRQLTTTLVTLRQNGEVDEVIVAEMGEAPVARRTAERWADKYVFIRGAGPFERARTLNVGSGLARGEVVLWSDNDLLTPPQFVARAASELRDRGLDYLIPYTSIHYLSESDSDAVMNGTRAPWECVPRATLYSGRRRPACSGGMGLVKRDFLSKHGGFIEGFRGWGGEDNAWNCKVALLGRAAPTLCGDQHAAHLYHPTSNGYPGQAGDLLNPHYAENIALLQRVHRCRDGARLLTEFPAGMSPPWNPGRRVAIAAAPGDGAGIDVPQVAQVLRSLYGDTVEEIPLQDGWTRQCAPAEAVVLFGDPEAARVPEGDLEKVRSRSVVVLGNGDCSGSSNTPLATRCAATLHVDGDRGDARSVALSLVGPLSLILAADGAGQASRETGGQDLAKPLPRREPELSVWTYWEGPCPDWIQACRATIVAHGGNVRLLGPADFDRLRDRDRDIDLSRLGPAHRADFIRAFLLARYGGLWIDADCLVMKPLQPLRQLVREHDFLAHRERSGYVSNGFIGARVRSQAAAELYERLCVTLRSRRPLGWISLGGQPLTEVLNARSGQWYELPCERIQPICWSDPGAFFDRGTREAHERRFDREAVCYMLSNTEVSKFAAAHPGARLLAPDSFFSFLFDQSREADDAPHAAHDVETGTCSVAPLQDVFAGFVAAYRRYGDESLSGPGSCLARTGELRARLPLLLEDLGIESLLDAGCGDWNWLRTVTLRLREYVGVDFLEPIVAANQRQHGGPRRTFLRRDIRTDPLPAADAVLCRDCLLHLSFGDIRRALRNFRSTGACYLLTTTFTDPRENRDTSDGEWRALNFERAPFCFPRPIRLLNERCTEADNAFADKSLAIWRLDDLPW